MPPTSKATFIVRLWTEEDPAEETSWRGVAERVGTERQCGFQELEELVDWMRQELTDTAGQPTLLGAGRDGQGKEILCQHN